MPHPQGIMKKGSSLSQGLVDKRRPNATAGSEKKADPRTNNNYNGRCGRFGAEFSVDLFSEFDTNGRTLALGHSFWTDKNPFVGTIKVFLFVFTISVYFNGVVLSPEPKFFLAYLTNWSLTYAFIYQTFSLLNTWIFDSLLLIKLSWAMFSVAAVHQVAVTILFWFAEYDSAIYSLTYFTLMSHGGVCLAVLVEGLLVNRVPVRLKHYIFNFLLGSIYLIWTLIQNLVLEYNPYNDDDDVALYDALAWKKDAKSAALFATLLLFVFLPFLQLWLWGASLLCRHYREDDEKGGNVVVVGGGGASANYGRFSRSLDIEQPPIPRKKVVRMAEI